MHFVGGRRRLHAPVLLICYPGSYLAPAQRALVASARHRLTPGDGKAYEHIETLCETNLVLERRACPIGTVSKAGGC
jgi:hypothetical protein